MKKLLTLLTLSLALCSACSTSLCKRKENWMAGHCAGGDVTWSPDPTCEANTESCSPAQLQQFQGYVQCLESQAMCTLETMGTCAQQYPGGVNLLCSPSS